MNRKEIRDRILDGLNEAPDNPIFWSTSQIDDVIDEAQEVLSEQSDAIRRTVLVPLRDGTIYYPVQGIAPDIMAPYRISTRHNFRRLTAASLNQLDRRHIQWMQATGDPWVWFPISWDLFGIYPHPAIGGNYMEINYIAWPRPLVDDEDHPEFPDADQDALFYYGIYDGLLKRWDLARATQLWAFFNEGWGEARFRSGMGRTQSRTWQATAANKPGFRNVIQF